MCKKKKKKPTKRNTNNYARVCILYIEGNKRGTEKTKNRSVNEKLWLYK